LRMMHAWLRRRAFEDPEAFRRIAVLHADDERPLVETLQPWQLKDIAAMDAGWMKLAGRAKASRRGESASPRRESGDGARVEDPAVPRLTSGARLTEARPVVCRRAYIERARGHSKTFDMAIQIAWILLAAKDPVRGMVAAADRDQARLIHEAVQKLARQNPWLCRHLHFVENEVRNKRTGSTLEVLSSDVSSSWGALPDFVICDELCHWSSPELWQSLISAAAKKPDCLVIVLSNAGIGRSWQWDIREHARRQPHWYFSSLPGPQAPWIDDDQLAEQKAL